MTILEHANAARESIRAICGDLKSKVDEVNRLSLEQDGVGASISFHEVDGTTRDLGEADFFFIFLDDEFRDYVVS